MNCDCMVYLGMTLDQAVSSFGWGAICDFARHMPLDSAVYRARNADEARYASALQQSAMLADIYDALNWLVYLYTKVHSGKPKKPESYPRPWKSKSDGAQHLGKGAIPLRDFNKWYYGR